MKPVVNSKPDISLKPLLLTTIVQVMVIAWVFILLWAYWVRMGMSGIGFLSILINWMGSFLVAINQFNIQLNQLINVIWIKFYNLNSVFSNFLIEFFSASYLQ